MLGHGLEEDELLEDVTQDNKVKTNIYHGIFGEMITYDAFIF